MLCTCTFCNAQDYGRIDTLFHWHGEAFLHFLQAYHDTVLARFESPADSNDHLDISYDAGKTWSFVTNKYRVKDYIPGRGSHAVGFDDLDDSDTSQQQFWIVRNGKIVHQDTIGTGHVDYPFRINNMIVHPMDPQIVFYDGVVNTVPGEVHIYYYSTNDGKDWKFIKVPRPTSGSAFSIEIRFDYSNASIWYFCVNGDDVVGGGNGDEWYQTTDSGRSFSKIDGVNHLNGLLGAGSSITFPQGKHLPGQKTSSYGEAILSNRMTGKIDSLNWMKNIAASLFPNSDTNRVTILSMSKVLGKEEDAELLFHPEKPGLFVLGLKIDSTDGNEVTRWSGLVATSDTGRTWTWVLRPVRYFITPVFCIDPLHGSIYLSANYTNDALEHNLHYMMLKITPWSVGVGDANELKPLVRI